VWGAADGKCRCIAPRQRGAWIETRSILNATSATFRASPLGNGGRGLKLLGALHDEAVQQASPLGNGGRGLKRISRKPRKIKPRIAPRQRGAWIETSRLEVPPMGMVASPLGNGGRGLKPHQRPVHANRPRASPLGNGGRGLKRSIARPVRPRCSRHRPSATGGVD